MNENSREACPPERQRPVGCLQADSGERRLRLLALQAECTEDNLWRCVEAFQGCCFYTSSGLPFTYRLKLGRRGEYTRELFIDRRENSKSLAWSSVRLAFTRALAARDRVFARPKEIADVRGISYSYSLLWRFGVIRVPEEVAAKLRGE